MTPEHLVILAAGVFLVAILYSSVGHAGASGYIAVMSLLSVAPAAIKPTALTLNILVASIGTIQFWRAGHFSWRLFWPFAVASVPLAFLGGYINLPTLTFKVLLGGILFGTFHSGQFHCRVAWQSQQHQGVSGFRTCLGRSGRHRRHHRLLLRQSAL